MMNITINISKYCSILFPASKYMTNRKPYPRLLPDPKPQRKSLQGCVQQRPGQHSEEPRGESRREGLVQPREQPGRWGNGTAVDGARE